MIVHYTMFIYILYNRYFKSIKATVKALTIKQDYCRPTAEFTRSREENSSFVTPTPNRTVHEPPSSSFYFSAPEREFNGKVIGN